MKRESTQFLFLNVGHFLDHYFMLIFATVAALRLSSQWGLTYAELIPYATPGFIAFGLCAIPAGWLADKWSREGMMLVFFVGIGISSIVAGFTQTPIQIALSLTLIGVFAAIYHPVGLSMVVQGRTKTGMPLAINGVFGNLGVACAALITGFLIDSVGWQAAFVLSGSISVFVGLLYYLLITGVSDKNESAKQVKKAASNALPPVSQSTLLRVFAIILITTALGGLVFQSTTFALPKIMAERLTDVVGSASQIGFYTFIVFAAAAVAQLVVGYLVDKVSVRPVFACVALLQVVFFVLMMHANGIAALLVAIAFMLAVFGQIPINDVLIGRIARDEWRSRAFALRYIVTFSVAASSVPLIAIIHGTWGFSRLFALLALAALLVFIATLFLPTFKTVNE